MVAQARSLAVIVNNAPAKRHNSDSKINVEINGILQTTLDVENMLELFDKQTHDLIPHDGYTFVNDELSLTISVGTQKHYGCHYKLVIAGQDLGTISLRRRTRFKKQETTKFENLLCALIYPLRNALLYHQALLSARTDNLTGVFNRTALEDSLDREFELARRQKMPLSAIMVDIDHFKLINDTHGHQVGDAVLSSFANCIKSVARKSDIVFRYGGEEFVIILSNTSLEGAALLSERIRKAVESVKIDAIKEDLNITASFGVAGLKNQEMPGKLLERVDQAMYSAKQNGRNQVSVIH